MEARVPDLVSTNKSSYETIFYATAVFLWEYIIITVTFGNKMIFYGL